MLEYLSAQLKSQGLEAKQIDQETELVKREYEDWLDWVESKQSETCPHSSDGHSDPLDKNLQAEKLSFNSSNNPKAKLAKYG